MNLARRSLVALAIGAAMAACVRHRTTDGGSNAVIASAPQIDAIRPDSVVVPRGSVVEVRISGRGFAAGSPGMNTIEFAGMSITSVPANADGTEIRFVIPEAVASNSEAPPRPLDDGTYVIRVRTAAGASNGKPLRIVR